MQGNDAISFLTKMHLVAFLTTPRQKLRSWIINFKMSTLLSVKSCYKLHVRLISLKKTSTLLFVYMAISFSAKASMSLFF